ncbi:hypothetical protein [Thalassotalea mangrovi]|uniref:Serine active site containing 1-like protein n=1 Tax=Thalassotalea mangrovi TaxID=2572245 RepID=A0A4V5NUE7_9GAMM|nr:hypothetical protein [Thalassotalea mangrovi]TKB46066.1 hypothetical protein E8M12_05405 [Thalassotalea mangrovi]
MAKENPGYPMFKLSYAVVICCLIMLLIWLIGPYSAHLTFAEDQGPAWYYWKLTEPTVWTRLSAWSLYIGHQVAIWYLIYISQKRKLSYQGSFRWGLHKENIQALAVNFFFVMAHIVQTKVYYDGLAQDTSNMAAMMSVVLVLAFTLVLEQKRRGFIFGKSLGWLEQVRATFVRYHGYYFSWAMIYTFWFHPIEVTLGHMLGTAYILFFLVQGSLFFTRFHTNRVWKTFLESFVIFHAVVVAYFSIHNESVSMFGFGFAAMFFATYIYGLGFSKKVIGLLSLGFILVCFLFYFDDLSQMSEVVRIPIILYLVALLFAGLVYLGVMVRNRLAQRQA